MSTLLFKFAGCSTNIWIVRSSIIKGAFLEAKQRPGGIHLTLQRLDVNILWQGRSGLTLDRLTNHIRTLLSLEDPPNYILFHIGGNDLGCKKLGYLHYLLERFLSWLSKTMPDSMLMWSQILPRLNWRYSNNLAVMDKCRRRLNSSNGAHINRNGGCYICYPDFKATNQFISTDGVHLAKPGNAIFLNTIQGGLETFILYTTQAASLIQMTMFNM